MNSNVTGKQPEATRDGRVLRMREVRKEATMANGQSPADRVDTDLRSMSMRACIVSASITRMDDANVARMEAELSQWGTELDRLVAEVETAGTEVKIDHRKGVADLKDRYEVTQSKLRECRVAGSATWKVFKAGLEAARNGLKTAFGKLGEDTRARKG